MSIKDGLVVHVYDVPDKFQYADGARHFAQALGDLGAGHQVLVLVDTAGIGATVLKELQQHGLKAAALPKVTVVDPEPALDLTAVMTKLVNVLAELNNEQRNRVLSAARILLDDNQNRQGPLLDLAHYNQQRPSFPPGAR
jgi:hypothetical protein